MADPDVSGVRAAAGPAVVAVSARVRWSWGVDAAVWTVAASGCALSYNAIQSAAIAHVDWEPLSYLLPLATDGAAIAAAARYVLDRRAGLSGRGWQAMAWAAIGTSIALNVVGRDLVDALWHVAGPAVLAAVTELYAHRAARAFAVEQHQALDVVASAGIPRRLWLTAPVSSWRLWLWMARTAQRDAVAARVALGRYAAAREALRAACTGRSYRRMRRVAARQLRAGTLAPAAVLDVLGWTGGTVPVDAPAALRALLATALAGAPGLGTDPRSPVASTGTWVETAPVEVDRSTGRVGMVLDSSPVASTQDIEATHGTTPLEATGQDRSGRVETSRGSRPSAPTAATRGRDEAQVRAELVAALHEGRLTPVSSVEEVRRVLGMAWRTARPWRARLAELAAEAAAVEVDGPRGRVLDPAAVLDPDGLVEVVAGLDPASVEPRGVDLDPTPALDPVGVDPVEMVPVEVDRPVWEAVA